MIDSCHGDGVQKRKQMWHTLLQLTGVLPTASSIKVRYSRQIRKITPVEINNKVIRSLSLKVIEPVSDFGVK